MEIAEIIKSLSILTVLDHYGIKMNRNKMVCCPFHDDKKPEYAGVCRNEYGILF
ncbi:MAG TPA: hypothetical protein PLC76_07705 [Saprospiraceae bacterium]|jgi:DNA primase|nr:hypothetical protein [Saprospiraceae bacterium]HRP84594.1 hypothetical protein [Saprospiraceae bacterium]